MQYPAVFVPLLAMGLLAALSGFAGAAAMQHGMLFMALILGFVLSDTSFWRKPDRN